MMFILFLSQFLWAQDPLLEGVWSQDCINQASTVTVQDFWTMLDFKSRHVCGISTWEMGKTEIVTGKFCEIFGKGFGIQIPPAGQKRFGIYKIEDDRLYFGRMTPEQDATTAEKRPTEFDGRFYHR